MYLNHPETTTTPPPPPTHTPCPGPWKDCLPWDWSLVPKRSGTTALLCTPIGFSFIEFKLLIMSFRTSVINATLRLWPHLPAPSSLLSTWVIDLSPRCSMNTLNYCLFSIPESLQMLFSLSSRSSASPGYLYKILLHTSHNSVTLTFFYFTV